MAKTAERARKGKADRTIIDHLAEKVFAPKPADEPTEHASTTPAGAPVEEQVRKEWNPKENGGLPIFARRRP